MSNFFALSLLAFSMVAPAHASVVLKDVTYKDGDTTLKGFIAYDDSVKGKRPGVIVVHEWWGITKHVKDYARELASKGYTALAVDMYGDGKTADVAYIVIANKGDVTTASHNQGDYYAYIRVTDDDVKPSENANPVKTLRMRYDAWKKAGSKPYKTVPAVALTEGRP